MPAQDRVGRSRRPHRDAQPSMGGLASRRARRTAPLDRRRRAPRRPMRPRGTVVQPFTAPRATNPLRRCLAGTAHLQRRRGDGRTGADEPHEPLALAAAESSISMKNRRALLLVHASESSSGFGEGSGRGRRMSARAYESARDRVDDGERANLSGGRGKVTWRGVRRAGADDLYAAEGFPIRDCCRLELSPEIVSRCGVESAGRGSRGRGTSRGRAAAWLSPEQAAEVNVFARGCRDSWLSTRLFFAYESGSLVLERGPREASASRSGAGCTTTRRSRGRSVPGSSFASCLRREGWPGARP